MFELITPNNCLYNQARLVNNRTFQKYPCAVAYCKTCSDVRAAIAYARKNHLTIRVRSGGHNYKAFSVGNGSLVIDVSNLNTIEINFQCSTVKVQGGVNNAQLYNAVAGKGYAFPGGSCPTVGVSGYTLGGGWGYSARYYGLGCDSLLEAKVMNYEGKVITANCSKHKDLFWALRGAGGNNFGVVISMTYQLPKPVDRITYFTYQIANPSRDTQISYFLAWQDWIATVTNRINVVSSIANTKNNGITIYGSGFLYGTQEELQQLLKPFSSLAGFTSSSYYISFLQAVNNVAANYTRYNYFYEGGRFTSQSYSADTWGTLVDRINDTRPEGSTFTALKVFGLGGKVKEVNSNETAFYYRNSNYIMSVETDFLDNSYDTQNRDWIMKQYSHIYPLTDGSYINFPFCPLPNYLTDYYGNNASALCDIAKKYDPMNLFCFPQGV